MVSGLLFIFCLYLNENSQINVYLTLKVSYCDEIDRLVIPGSDHEGCIGIGVLLMTL